MDPKELPAELLITCFYLRQMIGDCNLHYIALNKDENATTTTTTITTTTAAATATAVYVAALAGAGDSKTETDAGPKPQALHKTQSIFLRNLAPTITHQEVEAVRAAYYLSIVF